MGGFRRVNFFAGPGAGKSTTSTYVFSHAKILTDSPVMLSVCYARKLDFCSWEALLKIARDFEARFPSLNIYLKRGAKPYVQRGRYQTQEQAAEMDRFMRDTLSHVGLAFHEFPYEDRQKILDFILERL